MNKNQLAAKLRKLAKSYYDGQPQVSDAEFDMLKKHLREIDPEDETGFLSEVGAPVSGKTCKHRITMNSLDNVNNEAEFRKWYAKLPSNKQLVVQYKYDGGSMGLEYDNGSLTRGLTRGDGITGEDQTANVKKCWNSASGALGLDNQELIESGHGTIDNLNMRFSGCARGEALVFWEDFTAENFPNPQREDGRESNPRNSAVGAIRKDNSPRAKWVRIICYDLISDDMNFDTEVEKLNYMKELGLPVSEFHICDTADDVLDIYKHVQENRQNLPFMVDGLVLKLNDIQAQKDMGVHNDGRPRGQTAFKFECMEAITTLREVELAVGHTGNITLRGHYDPITLDGRTFQHTNLDNFDLVKRLGVAVGDKVTVQIAGDIIPKIVDLHEMGEDRQEISPPTTCPSCGGPVNKIGAFHKCTNDECEARGVRKVRKWVETAKIKYYGPSIQEQLYNCGLVTEPAHLYTVSTLEMGNIIGHGNAERIREEIEQKRELPLEVFMGGLGIPMLGRRQAIKLMESGIDTLEKFLLLDPIKGDDGVTVTIDGVRTKIEGFKDNLVVIANGIKKSAKTINNLLESGVEVKTTPKPQLDNTDSPLAGKTFCFTGFRLKGDEVTQFIQLGGVEKSSVSKKLDYLVCRNKDSASNKAEKARKYGVTLLNKQEFLDLLESAKPQFKY
ncbi:MAG: NAD-dependent DNA ligase LigA [Candidatus Lokiarchaeota archaeon]|nr:NAD-dependent DNA ligase LigA [Candidatus Lokiarchaeota archaeon]